MIFNFSWTNKKDGDDIYAEHVNSLADGIKETQEAVENISIDTEMSDTSTNAVQNKVVKTYIDESVGDVEDKISEVNDNISEAIDGLGGFWGLDLPLIKTITLEESVTSIDILSKAEGIKLKEFTVLLFIKALGDVVESNISNCGVYLRTNGGQCYFGYKGGYTFNKRFNSFAFWHTKIYDNKFALTDLYSGLGSGNGGGVPYWGSQGLADATTTPSSSYAGYSGDAVDNLNVFISSNDVSRGAIIPQGSMIFLLGR